MRTVDTLEKLSYGTQKIINTLYLYKFKDQTDFIDVTSDATKAFHAEKSNFLCNQKPNKQPKKKKPAKKFIIV